ncbi:MAG: hypothetical protein A2075_05715 [Geobacteraceae bacterium GWC2_58_44]|nr:MAG: hypothetical protein A2075_05715 [Geobacteraceae bacterium GWC2_58_44]
MTAPKGARRWGALAAESSGSLLLVLVVFWLFILFLYAVFPSGTPLKELMESRMEPVPGRYAVERRPEATLVSLFRDVRFRRGNSVAWGGASQGMQLYSQDAVQTFDRSGAGISFGARDVISVGSNSLVVVTRLDAGGEAGSRSYRVQVDGEVSGTLSAARKLRMEFAAAGHLARIVPGAARFRVARNGDSSASLAMYAGEAQVAGRAGMVRVPANYGVTLRRGVPVGPAVPLPAAPLLGADKALYRYRLLPPRVRFTWSGAAENYHFQLAKDARFQSCLIDEKLGGGEFVTGKLANGAYFWRVSGVEEGREGLFSRVGRCELVQVLKSPELQVSFPPERAPAGPCLLSGSMEPGTRVFVDGVEVASDQGGNFQRELRLKPGVNLIRVEALDPSGNASYASRIVYGTAVQKGAQQAPL